MDELTQPDSLAGLPGLDALDDRDGPALPLSESQRSAMLAAVLERATAPTIARSRKRVRPRWLLAAALVSVATGAAAQYGETMRGLWRALRSDAIEERDTPQSSPAPRRAPAAETPREEPPPREPEPAAAEPEPIAAEPEPIALREAAPTRPRPAHSRARLQRRATAPRAREVKDWMAQANESRRHGRYAQAREAYLRVVRKHPRAAEAQPARVAAAQLLLAQEGRIGQAEALYREAVRQGGALAAEARFGLAECRRAAGDRAGEARALRAYLNHHPSGPFEAAARARLEEISE